VTRRRYDRYDAEAHAELAPGTRTYRALEREADVAVQWAVAWRVAACACVIALGMAGWKQWPALWPLWASIVGVAGLALYVFLRLEGDLFGDDSDRRITGEKPLVPMKLERPEPRPAPPERMEVVVRKPAVRYQDRRFDLALPAAGGNALARFFWRVLRDDCTLAIRKAQAYGITRDEVEAIKAHFTDNELGEDQGGNLGVKPNDDGDQFMRELVQRFYPDARLPLDDVQGVD